MRDIVGTSEPIHPQAPPAGVSRERAPADAADSGASFWDVPIESLLTRLGASTRGLSSVEAARRLAAREAGGAAKGRPGTVLRHLAAQFTSPITVLLLGAATLSVALGERTDGAIILGILLIGAALGFWQEHRAAGAVARLLAMLHTTATVVRDGVEQAVPIDGVVPGDVVRLVAGASVPGDARLLAERDLFVDEAALTGESFPVEKAPGVLPADTPLGARSNAVFLGTHVASGTGTALVVRTGRATEFGTIGRRLTMRAPVTEFEHGVRRFGGLLLEITSVLAIVIFAINVALHRPVLDALLFTLALAVGLTPQLLPAIVSVTLAQGARRMARERVIVRRLAAIEDLGGMEILCTDKTGTITEGRVAVHGVTDWRGSPSGRAALLAHLNATFQAGFPNPIDEALRAITPEGAAAYTKVDEVPYDFARKRLSIAVTDGGSRLLITKGAVRAVLDVCETATDDAGRVVPIAEARQAIDAQVEALSRAGYRTIAIASRLLTGVAGLTRDDERALTLAGLVSLADPIKPDVPATLRALRNLGIRVKLITGDDRRIAARLADDAGIAATAIRTGSEVQRMTEAALVRAAPGIELFAEVEPHQKQRIILALRKAGYAVGYLGDGINDAPALHAADVGISVDSATDVTRQAADIVLLEKDLAVLALGVREGRRAFANTLKYVFITTSANFGNMFSMAGASLFAAFLPLLPQQILLINVLTDVPAMAIATDRLDPELVQRPRRWDTGAIRRFMITFGLVSSAFDLLTFAVLMQLAVPVATFRTAWFTESILSELMMLLVVRTSRRFYRSEVGRTMLWLSVTVAAATLLMPHTPLAGILGFAPLSPGILAMVLGIVALYTAASEASKRVLTRRSAQ